MKNTKKMQMVVKVGPAFVTATKNQCDGCAIGMPKNAMNLHYTLGGDVEKIYHMACTANRYS